MYTANMIRTQIYIPSEIHETAKMLAARDDRSIADLYRLFITKGIANKKKTMKKSSLASLSNLNITGGPKDLSKNMDKYLYG